MKMIINRNGGEIQLNFSEITQLCGQNMILKRYILDSICKHFSSEKYKEYEECYINNISIDGEIPGRKQWECYRIKSIEDIIATIQMNKGSILGKCIKECVGDFECQNQLLQIDNILLDIFERVNQKLFVNQMVELQYTPEDLFSMIQQTSVRTKDGKDIHELSIENLLKTFIELVSKQQSLLPEKRLYVFENIDHYVTSGIYGDFLVECEKLSRISNLWFIFSTSLEGYIYTSSEVFDAINIINDEVYSLPTVGHILDFIGKYYPVERKWTAEDICKVLSKIANDVGKNDSLIQPKEIVLLKLINETVGVKDRWKKSLSKPEIQCLLDDNVI